MVSAAAVGLHFVAIGSRYTDLSRGVGRNGEVPLKMVAIALPIAFDVA